jgi:tRNA threonylcarbamoyladenosine biosynthesis protein TsaB
MTILCCDTSTEYAVFALADRAGSVIASLAFAHERDLSRRFFASLDSLLGGAGIRFDTLSALAVGIGPGSFTGVRVAVSTMRTLAQVKKLPLVGFGTLECYALGAAGGLLENALIVPILPSRRGEVYAAVYQGGKELQHPFVATYDQLAERLAGLEGEGIVLCGATAQLPPPLDGYTQMEITSPPAEAMALLAARELEEDRLADPFSLNPLYVAPPAISQHMKESPPGGGKPD